MIEAARSHRRISLVLGSIFFDYLRETRRQRLVGQQATRPSWVLHRTKRGRLFKCPRSHPKGSLEADTGVKPGEIIALWVSARLEVVIKELMSQIRGRVGFTVISSPSRVWGAGGFGSFHLGVATMVCRCCGIDG